jgi:hypothetical protein
VEAINRPRGIIRDKMMSIQHNKSDWMREVLDQPKSIFSSIVIVTHNFRDNVGLKRLPHDVFPAFSDAQGVQDFIQDLFYVSYEV